MPRRLPCIVAHRGASHDAPENTLAAFRLAFEQGADAIEGDFHQTADGQIVCIHDADTQRTGDRVLTVAHSTLAELQNVDVGAWKAAAFAGERVPTLEQVLAVVPPGRGAYLEIKSGPDAVPAVAQSILAGAVPLADIRLLSFDAAVIAACKQALPAVQAFWALEFESGQTAPVDPAPVLATLAQCHADGLDVENRDDLVTPAFAAALAAAGRSLHVWTIDTPASANQFVALGVESITTNRPRFIRDCLERLPW